MRKAEVLDEIGHGIIYTYKGEIKIRPGYIHSYPNRFLIFF